MSAPYLLEFPELSEILCSIRKISGLVSLPSVSSRTIQFPVCHTPKEQQHLFFWQNYGPPRWIASWIPPSVLSCVNNWHVSLVIRKWFSNSPDKYAGIVTSKYPFTRVNSFRIKQAPAARSFTLSLLSRMVQLSVSQSPCPKAAKMFKKSAIFKQQSFTQHALCCKACDQEFWEAVGCVPFDQRKFRKFEPVIFVEWKAPHVSTVALNNKKVILIIKI